MIESRLRPTLEELWTRAVGLEGHSLERVAADVGLEVPQETLHAKGLTGKVAELFLGASSGSKSEPDFPHLGIELKTIPLDGNGKPLESTYVTHIDLDRVADEEWETSAVLRKLSWVLWVPIEGSREIPFRERRFLKARLWKPSQEQMDLLRTDWEELTAALAIDPEGVTAHLGRALQVRPKGPDGKARARALNEDGFVATMPRGFYLRSNFTQSVLAHEVQSV